MPPSLASTLAARVREERLRLGWTQADAAAHVGISRRSYLRFEQAAETTVARLVQVLDAFGLTLAVIAATGATQPTPDPRVLRTRQRGLRHTPPAAARGADSAAGDPVAATALPPKARPSASPAKPSVAADPGRREAVLKQERDRIFMLIRVIVSNRLTNYTSYQVVQNTMNAAKQLAEADRPAFVAVVESQLAGLTAENIGAYGIAAANFERWAPGWNPELGIVDVLAPAERRALPADRGAAKP